MNIYLIITFGGILGMVAHTWRTLANINKRHDKATFRMVLDEYWASDKYAIVFSLLCFGIILFVSSEFVNLNKLEEVNNQDSLKERLFNFRLAFFIKTASVIAGWFADSIIYGWMGVAEKRLIAFFKATGDEIKPTV